ncbi:MAG TPA: hypothetical protein VHY84_27395 [Bryobacteraceae bacterium]|nr:hypothetical protein [Bryobacteraceae bacterium]
MLGFWYDYGPELREWWQAGYPIQLETDKGPKTAHVEIDGVRSAECPKSVMLRDPRADDLVQIFVHAEGVGASALGPPAAWPGWYYDTVKILKDQTVRDEAAIERAVRRA